MDRQAIILSAKVVFMTVALLGLAAWAFIGTNHAQRFCHDRGYAQGVALVGGGIRCLKGEIFNGTN